MFFLPLRTAGPVRFPRVHRQSTLRVVSDGSWEDSSELSAGGSDRLEPREGDRLRHPTS